VRHPGVLVTGGSSGIGRATAIRFAAQGAKVLAVARSQDKLDALARDADVEVFSVSLSTREGCEQAFAEATTRLGSVDVLVNNAGSSDSGGAIWEVEDRSWRESLAIYLDAPFYLSRLASAEMIKRKWGRIIMVSSTAGEVGAPGFVSFCSAKHGVIGLMRAIAQDLAPYNATCNAVLPGWVKTPATDRAAEREASERGVTAQDIWREREASYPGGRVLSPDEIAQTIVFLASEAASGVNGEAMTVALGSTW
jgi:NAD(P)-dependent dehydrogenase (short-subunit alcohol dehydrogenase family)